MTEEVDQRELERWRRVAGEWQERGIRIQQADSRIAIGQVREEDPYIEVDYHALNCWTMKQRNAAYEQAWVERRRCLLKEDRGWWILEDRLIPEKRLTADDFCDDHQEVAHPAGHPVRKKRVVGENNARGSYDRRKAVQYAERWWDDYNPQFISFDVDCTNYVSQCLWAGGAPMKYAADRDKGWWYRFGDDPQWSFSWSVAHSLRWFLASSPSGLRATEVATASELQPGDIIAYDFDGDGRWEHNTIVVAKDEQGEPLVNAHTTNSRMRYWSYRDSYAWTEQTAYKFFHIADPF